MSKDYNQIELVQTCGACPEQYDAYLNGEKVGYLRLRHGTFRVDYGGAGGETIYSASPIGDGCFEVDEREGYLKMAKKKIYKQYVKNQ